MESVRTVAVIGGGISGVCSAAHLLKYGLEVTLFERSSITGGVWHFDSRSANDPSYPNGVASLGDYERQVFEDLEFDSTITPPRTPQSEQLHKSRISQFIMEAPSSITFAPPGPCYEGLKNNVALSAMRTSLAPWPPGLEEFVSQRYLEEYIQQIAFLHKVEEITRYNTRVETVLKSGRKWIVYTTTYANDTQFNVSRVHKSIYLFDAVVVASGHYNMPRIPDIPGLKEWKKKFPDRIAHSKGYREARKFAGQNVLIIGGGVSSVDITKEIVAVGGTVYQSTRGGEFDLPASVLPGSASRVSEVASFNLDEQTTVLNSHSDAIPGRVKLADGSELTDIHHIILATGYITSYPFLPNFHSDDKSRLEADHRILVTKEGDMVHNLHKDVFYLEDPTLAFVGVPYHVSTFSLFDFQAQVVARIFANEAVLPSLQEMRAEYTAKVAKKGLGRHFHSLRATGAEIEYVAGLVSWMNQDLRVNVTEMRGHTEEFLRAYKIQREQLALRYGWN